MAATKSLSGVESGPEGSDNTISIHEPGKQSRTWRTERVPTGKGNDLRNGVLVRLFDIDVPGPRKYYLVYPPRLAASPKLALFRAWLHAEIALDEAQPKPRVATAPRGASRKAKR